MNNINRVAGYLLILVNYEKIFYITHDFLITRTATSINNCKLINHDYLGYFM